MSSIRVVELRGVSQSDARLFLCQSDVWRFLRDLGQTFGWHPRGTTYVTNSRQGTPPASLRHNYQPGGVQDYKQVATEDAIEWAKALTLAKDSAYFDGMIRAYVGLTGNGDSQAALLKTLDEFIAFAHQGAFVFAVSAESGTANLRSTRQSLARSARS